MNTFSLEIFDDEGLVCSFYTVRREDAPLSETEKFFAKYEKDPTLERSLQELAQFIFRKMGDETGAREAFFRFENTAHALPPAGRHLVEEVSIRFAHFPLRLYCLRLSESLVILFNGGVKTAQTAQSGKTSMAFREANQFAQRILSALEKGDIRITPDGRTLQSADGSDDLIL